MKLKDLLEKVSNKRILIYGAHLIALEMYRIIISKVSKNSIVGFAVSSMLNNPTVLEGIKVREIDEYEVSGDIVVVVAVPEKYHKDINETLYKKGFTNIILVDQECAENIKTEIILLDISNTGGYVGEYRVYEDVYDKSWLNVKKDSSTIHIKFPTLFYRDKTYLYDKLEIVDLDKECKRIFGNYNLIHKIDEKKIDYQLANKFKVYMVYSQWDNGSRFDRETSDWIVPIQAGCSIATNITGNLRDDMGINISMLNRTFAEMSVAYWIWKNENNATYKGLCHYRRHFNLSEQLIATLVKNEVDVILTTPRFAPGGVKEMFVHETPVNSIVFENLKKAIEEIHHKEAIAFDNYINSELYSPNNMVIAKNNVYDRYCEWIFPILFRLIEIDEEIKYGHDTDRHPAYAAELLTSYYFASRSANMKIYFVDYSFFSN